MADEEQKTIIPTLPAEEDVTGELFLRDDGTWNSPTVDLDSVVDTINDKVTAINGKSADLTNKIEVLGNTITNVNTTSTYLNSRLGILETQVNNLVCDTSTSQPDITDTITVPTIPDATTNKLFLRDDGNWYSPTDELEDIVDTLTEKSDSIDDRLEVVETFVEAHGANLEHSTSMSSRLSTVEGLLGTASTVNSLMYRVAALETQVTNLINTYNFNLPQSPTLVEFLRDDGTWAMPVDLALTTRVSTLESRFDTEFRLVDTASASATGREVVNAEWVRRYINSIGVSGGSIGTSTTGGTQSISYCKLLGVTRGTYTNGSIVSYLKDGYTYKFLVLDAAYRGYARFGCFGTNATLPDTMYTGSALSWRVEDTDVYVESVDTGTAKNNCDIWTTFNSAADDASSYPYEELQDITGVPAVNWCRSITVGDDTCNLPTIQQLILIYLLANEIDALDPTVDNYLHNALGDDKNPEGYWKIGGYEAAWSSTEFNKYSCRAMYSNGVCSYHPKVTPYAVVPILELSNSEN